MKNKKAFTLIELIAVLVILAILALIVTPLVLNIIKKARTSADKRSIDAYGRSVELAVADYLLDKGEFPTSIEQLTIEYTGDKVECTTTQLKEDGSVYLAECTVNERAVAGYTYGKTEEEPTPTYDAYEVGDEVTYNNVNYYVIKDSDATETSVTLLKTEPLTVAEVNEYGAGHVNRYTSSSQGTAYNQNGYGGMTYYSSDTCRSGNTSGCTSDYAESDIKYAVDAWAQDNTTASDLVEDSTGYKARLLTYDELTTSLGYTPAAQDVTSMSLNSETVPSFVYNSNYRYLTMSPYQDEAVRVWYVGNNGSVNANYLFAGTNYSSVVRPVITLSKSAL